MIVVPSASTALPVLQPLVSEHSLRAVPAHGVIYAESCQTDLWTGELNIESCAYKATHLFGIASITTTPAVKGCERCY